MRKLAHIAATTIVGMASIHAAAAQSGHDRTGAARAAVSSPPAAFESSVAEASGIIDDPSGAAASQFGAVASGVLAGEPAAGASPAQGRSAADLGTLTSGLSAPATAVPRQASGAMIEGDVPASVAVAPSIFGGDGAAFAGAATEAIRPTPGVGSVSGLFTPKPSRKR